MRVTIARRTLLFASSTAAALAALVGCNFVRDQKVRHILPSVSDTEIWITVSLAFPAGELSILADGAPYHGRQVDSAGRHWSFHIDGLASSTTYQLQLIEAMQPVGEAWPLKTFPAPRAEVKSMRLGAFTCAGGGDGFGFNGLEYFKPHSFRHRLFDELLGQSPDAVIAIGDHIYWDLRGGDVPPLGQRRSAIIRWIIGAYLKYKYGAFDRTLPLIGSENEAVLKRIADEQIADLYGTRFKSTPIFFVADDHDYFENDDAEADLVTFPADEFSRAAHQAVADLYYPPLTHPPSPELNRSFGIVRYGSLFEAPLIDCAGFMTLAGEDAVLFSPTIERWLTERIETSDASHFVMVPSHPMGWTAGKWREWYPDVVAPEGFEGTVANRLNLYGDTKGVLTARANKYLWQMGWWLQHQRVLKALAKRTGSRFMLSGDIHAQGAVEIIRSGDFDLAANAITSVLTGPVSTSSATWPSFARGIAARQPEWLQAVTLSETNEVNGFTVVSLKEDSAIVQLNNCGGNDAQGDDGSIRDIETFPVP